jgi:hypothetical protein
MGIHDRGWVLVDPPVLRLQHPPLLPAPTTEPFTTFGWLRMGQRSYVAMGTWPL